jgi:X-X-X-Leu-X-X-Gly heptad repeat protein
MTRFTRSIAPVLVVIAAAAGCSSKSDSTANQTPTTVQNSADSSMSSSTVHSGSTTVHSGSTTVHSGSTTVHSSAAAGTTVDPNTASAADITAALEANGVTNAAKWTKEIKEYGPYTAADLAPTLTKNLAKYKISADDLAKLLATLVVK